MKGLYFCTLEPAVCEVLLIPEMPSRHLLKVLSVFLMVLMSPATTPPLVPILHLVLLGPEFKDFRSFCCAFYSCFWIKAASSTLNMGLLYFLYQIK